MGRVAILAILDHRAPRMAQFALAGRRLRRLGRALNGRWSRRAPLLALAALAFTLPSDGRAQSPPDPETRLTALGVRLGMDAPAFARDEPLVDWYPAANGFRVTSGRTSDRQGKLAPYLGIGWQGAWLSNKVLIGLDMGALYDGRPELRMADTGRSVAAADPGGLDTSRFHPAFSLTFTYRF